VARERKYINRENNRRKKGKNLEEKKTRARELEEESKALARDFWRFEVRGIVLFYLVGCNLLFTYGSWLLWMNYNFDDFKC